MPYAESVIAAPDIIAGPDLEPHGLEGLLGEAAWQRLPAAVRVRFRDPAVAVDYTGEFEVVRASPIGRFLAWLSPGTTHVEHVDEGTGWFRFTMTVRHPVFGELFYQTGRFCAAGELTCS